LRQRNRLPNWNSANHERPRQEGGGTSGGDGGGICAGTRAAREEQAFFSSAHEETDVTPGDADRIFGDEFTKQVKVMGIQEVLSAPRSPWQRAYIERMIGTLRRECLDHMIVFNEASRYRHVKLFMAYYHESGVHLSLAKARRNRGPCTRRNWDLW
jgi:transposase InsO family protein